MLKRFLILFLAMIVAAIAMLYKSDMPLDELKALYANEESKFVAIDGMDVHYRVEGSGPVLVLLHGTSSSLHTWDSWTEVLKGDFTIVRLDLPAFGLTGPNATKDYSLEAYSQFLDKFLAAVNVDTFYLAGNSLGGGIAMNYTLDHPEKVQKLILIDASGYPREAGKRPWIFRLASNPVVGGLLKNLTPKSLVRSNMEQVYYDDAKISDDLVDRYYHLLLRAGNRQAFIDRSNTQSQDRTGEYSKVEIPVLVQFGRHDLWIPIEHASRYDEDLPNSQLIIYENAGHVPMEEIPMATAEDARRFLLGGEK
jgi:pimeloyl-ACP methyl ester carboxylesterase